jgi:sortase (surface protein transpeptidase)
MGAHVRRLIAVAMATFLLASAGATANAETIKRTWTTKVGSSGVNGPAALHAYMSGTGLLNMNFKSLRANTAYGIQIRAGTCANLGTVRASLFPVTTSPTGTVATFRNIPGDKMNAIWKAARAGSIAIRIGTGTLARCGNLKFKVATRITIPKLSIDLPVIRGTSSYPLCRVAAYLPQLSQPREPGVTFLYAHARSGMFLPLLSRSKINNGASLIGMRVRVYTSDSRLSTYAITQVRRHVTSVQSAFGITDEELWLQTSEGPNFTYPKLIVVAKRLSTTVTTFAASHPTPRPVAC